MTAAALAAEAYALIGSEPERALALAREALAQADDGADAAAARVAQGMAELELGSAARAIATLEAAVATAHRAHAREADARMSLAFALTYAGETPRALREARRALEAPGAVPGGRALLRWAIILDRLGRLDEAVAVYRRALAALRAEDDREGELRALCGRGVVHAYRGALSAAERDLRDALVIADASGRDLLGAMARNNLGFVAMRRGDVAGALAHYDAAEPAIAKSGPIRHAVLELDRCEALLSAGLASEARAGAERALTMLDRTKNAADAAEAQLMRAQAALAEEQWLAAGTAAGRAEAAFRAQRRPGWALLARHAAIRAQWREQPPTPELATRARRLAAGLARAGWPVAALDARVVAARIALALGDGARARRDLAQAARARAAGPVALRVSAWHAEALRRESADDRRGTRAAVRAGLAVLEAHRAGLAATELRAHAADHGRELAALGLRLALEGGNADDVLSAAERFRSGVLRMPPARPPADPELAGALAELRAVAAEADAAAREGAPTEALVRRQTRLEQQVRRAALHAGSEGPAEPGRAASAGELRALLGDRALVQFLRPGDRLCAVAATARRSRLVDLGPLAEVHMEADGLRSALTRMASTRTSPESVAVYADNADAAAARLGELLLAPFERELDVRELVLVPTGRLHALPWGALPQCAGRRVSIAPSGTLWRRALAAPQRPGDAAAVVAGPGLEHAGREVAGVAALYEEPTRLEGAAATAPAVRAALERSNVAHLACHGTFRTDNPLFSSLTMADGPLTVYDLERLSAVPARMVLSACDSALTAVRPGDELMGLATALLGLGTSALVASVVPVPDEPACALMVAFHEQLRAGASPAAALERARSALDPGDHRARVARDAFVCLGAG